MDTSAFVSFLVGRIVILAGRKEDTPEFIVVWKALQQGQEYVEMIEGVMDDIGIEKK